MATDTGRLVVGVFDLRERAERSVEQLLADGYGTGDVLVITGPELPPACAAAWTADGVTAERMAYYAGELRAGRWLVTVTCCHDLAGVLGAFGRNGGSLRVPEAIRAGRC